MSEYKNKKIKDEATLLRSENFGYQRMNAELNEQVKQLLESIEILKKTNEELKNKLKEKMKKIKIVHKMQKKKLKNYYLKKKIVKNY